LSQLKLRHLRTNQHITGDVAVMTGTKAVMTGTKAGEQREMLGWRYTGRQLRGKENRKKITMKRHGS
jgi:hypothetical protein